MAKRKKYDWEAIERDYRAGLLSITEIAKQHSCSRALIYKRAKIKNLKRDLSERIRREARARFVAESVTNSDTTVTENQIVENGSSLIIEALRRHNKVIGETFVIAEKLIEASKLELDANTLCNIFRSVTQGLDKAISLERQALNMDGDERGRGDAPMADLDRAARIASLLELAKSRNSEGE